MPRAILTAKKMFRKSFDIEINENFIEFDLTIIHIPFVKLKFKTWLLISRIFWFANLIYTSRSFKQERFRAKKCANILHKKAGNSCSVALISHGMLGFFIEKNLMNNSYKRISKIKNKSCSITKLVLS